jgi:hypothetical protein
VSGGLNFAGREYTVCVRTARVLADPLSDECRRQKAEGRGQRAEGRGWRKGKEREDGEVARATQTQRDFARSRLRNKRRVLPRSKEDGEPTNDAAEV